METMFAPIRFKTHIQLTPRELQVQFEKYILDKIRSQLEGICGRYGYIRPKSVSIVKRSAGMLMKPHFNGHIRFEVLCKALVCNPPQGMVVEAVVRNKNELGLYAESSIELDGEHVPILDIIVPSKSAGIVSELDLSKVQSGDTIFVEVVGKTFKYRDLKISIIGRLVKDPHQKVAIIQEEPEEVAEEEGNEDILDLDDFVLESSSSVGEEVEEGGMDGENPVKEIELEEQSEEDEAEEEEEEEDPEEDFDDDGDDGDDIEDDISVGGIGLDDA
jgi:DNA-directed RNA polymerase subunit E'/Rpb7